MGNATLIAQNEYARKKRAMRGMAAWKKRPTEVKYQYTRTRKVWKRSEFGMYQVEVTDSPQRVERRHRQGRNGEILTVEVRT